MILVNGLLVFFLNVDFLNPKPHPSTHLNPHPSCPYSLHTIIKMHTDYMFFFLNVAFIMKPGIMWWG
jgi:hypothetical protein